MSESHYVSDLSYICISQNKNLLEFYKDNRVCVCQNSKVCFNCLVSDVLACFRQAQEEIDVMAF